MKTFKKDISRSEWRKDNKNWLQLELRNRTKQIERIRKHVNNYLKEGTRLLLRTILTRLVVIVVI